MAKRKERDGLRKRCTCGARRWDGCPHPWHFRRKLPGQAKRQRLNLQDRFKVAGTLTREQAEALADRARVELRAPASFDMRLTLGDVAGRFVAAHVDEKPYYVTALRQSHVATVTLDAKAVADITADDIEQAAKAWQARARAKHGSNGGQDAKRHFLTTARRLFNWAIKQKMTRSTPFRFEGQSMIDVPTSRQRDRRLVDDEETRLLNAADLYTKDLMVAALETGCRGGELRSLQWQDVQTDIIVLTVEKTKTRRKRLIPISPTLRAVLDRRRQGPDGQSLLATAYVFGNAVGEPVSRRLPNRWWAVTCAKAGGTGVNFHDLRHEFASQLLEAGGELHEVQAALGHTNIKMTSTYLNATLAGVKQAFKTLETKRRRKAMRVVAR